MAHLCVTYDANDHQSKAASARVQLSSISTHRHLAVPRNHHMHARWPLERVAVPMILDKEPGSSELCYLPIRRFPPCYVFRPIPME